MSGKITKNELLSLLDDFKTVGAMMRIGITETDEAQDMVDQIKAMEIQIEGLDSFMGKLALGAFFLKEELLLKDVPRLLDQYLGLEGVYKVSTYIVAYHKHLEDNLKTARHYLNRVKGNENTNHAVFCELEKKRYDDFCVLYTGEVKYLINKIIKLYEEEYTTESDSKIPCNSFNLKK